MHYRGNIIGFADAGGPYCFAYGEHFHKPMRICMDHHAHIHLELIFITRGKFYMGTGDFSDCFEEGDVFIANSMEDHWGKCPFRPHSENIYRFLMLDPRQLPPGLSAPLDRLIEGEFRIANKIPADEARKSGLFEYGIRLLDACCRKEGHELEMLGYAVLLLQALISHPRKETVQWEKSGFALQVVQFIEEHYREELSMETVAKEFGYEKSYFCRKFRRIFDQSFTDYLNRTRTKKFISHPALNQQTIAYCAQEVGYASYPHFYQTFKRYYKISPREFLVNRATGLK